MRISSSSAEGRENSIQKYCCLFFFISFDRVCAERERRGSCYAVKCVKNKARVLQFLGHVDLDILGGPGGDGKHPSLRVSGSLCVCVSCMCVLLAKWRLRACVLCVSSSVRAKRQTVWGEGVLSNFLGRTGAPTWLSPHACCSTLQGVYKLRYVF